MIRAQKWSSEGDEAGELGAYFIAVWAPELYRRLRDSVLASIAAV